MTAHHWLAVFVAVNLLDAALTLYGLRLGSTEANPLLRALMRRVSPWVALALVKGALIAAFAMLIDQIGPQLPWVVAAYISICAWNVAQILMARKQ